MICLRRLPDGTEVPVDVAMLPAAMQSRLKAFFLWHAQHGGARPERVILGPGDAITLDTTARGGGNGQVEAQATTH